MGNQLSAEEVTNSLSMKFVASIGFASFLWCVSKALGSDNCWDDPAVVAAAAIAELCDRMGEVWIVRTDEDGDAARWPAMARTLAVLRSEAVASLLAAILKCCSVYCMIATSQRGHEKPS